MNQPSATAPVRAIFATSTLLSAHRGVPLLARVVTIFLCAGGLVGMITSFFLIKDAWPWPMPDLAYRFLAGAATAYAVGSLLTLRDRRWPASELLMTTVVLYGLPLCVSMIVGRDAVDWGEFVAWSFLALIIPAVAIALLTVALNRNIPQPAEPLDRALRATLLVLGVLASVVGAWVYIAPRESGTVWPWAELGPWKPVDTRLLASMLLTIGGGALLIAWRNRRSQAAVFLPMLWAYCLVASIGLAIHADASPAFRTEDITYIIIFSVVLLVTLGLWLRGRVTGSEASTPRSIRVCPGMRCRIELSEGAPRMSTPAKIVIVPYDETWPAQFERVAEPVRAALGEWALRIDHIGSTSVPGLAAKDVIDVQVTVANLDAAREPVVTALTALGYGHIARISGDHAPPSYDPDPAEWRKLVFSQPPEQRRVNLHVRELGRANQRYALRFRDYLRTSPLAAGAYAQIKLALARLHPNDIDAYYDIKDPVCDIIMAAAEARG